MDIIARPDDEDEMNIDNVVEVDDANNEAASDAAEKEVWWEDGMNFSDFAKWIDRLTASGVEISAHLCFQFVMDYIMEPDYLEGEGRQKLLEVLRRSTITDLPIFYVTSPTYRSYARRRLAQLCDALGSIATLETASLILDSTWHSWTLSMAIQSLQQLKNLSIGFPDEEAGEDDVAIEEANLTAMANDLQYHPSLESLTLALPTIVYRRVLPALQTIPNFTTLKLDGTFCKNVALEDAQAIQELMQSDNPLKLELKEFNISQVHLFQCLSAGLTSPQMRSFAMDNCKLQSTDDGMAVAHALAQSQVRRIRVACSPGQDTSIWSGFLIVLALRLPMMFFLEELDLDFGGVTQQSDPELYKALSAVVQAALFCLRLNTLLLGLGEYVSPIEQALALCVRTNTVLEVLLVELPQPKDTATFQACSSPALLEAMTYNHTIQQIDLCSRYEDESSGIDPWDKDFQQTIETIVELNRSGRAYLRMDDGPEKKADGVHVLTHVRHKLDCIYYHLCENPGLCAS